MDIENQPIVKPSRRKLWIVIGTAAILLVLGAGAFLFWKPMMVVKVSIADKKESYKLGDTITANIKITNYSIRPYVSTFSSTNTDPDFRIDGLKPDYHMIASGQMFTSVRYGAFKTRVLTAKINLVNNASWVNDAGVMNNYDLVFKPGENRIMVHWAEEGSDTIYINPADFYEEKIDCKLFADPTRQAQCNYEYGEAPSSIEACRVLADEFMKVSCYGDYAAATNDPSVCDELNPEGKDDCIWSLYFKTKNLSYCELMTDPSPCYYLAASELKDASYCDKIPDTESRDNCYQNLGDKDFATEAICEKISDAGKKGQCYKSIVEHQKGDISLCDKVVDEGQRTSCHFVYCLRFEGDEMNGCYKDIALELNNSRPCDLIKDEAKSTECKTLLDTQRKEGAEVAVAEMIAGYEADALERIKANPVIIKDFKNPAEKYQLAAVELQPTVIKYIENPTEAVQMLAVQAHPMNVIYIENPTEKAQAFVASSDPAKLTFLMGMKEAELNSYYDGMGAKISLESFRTLINLINS